MIDHAQWAERIALAKALLAMAKETKAAARNQRHTAVLRRALDKRMRQSGSLSIPLGIRRPR